MTTIIDREAVLAGLSAEDVEDTFAVTEGLFEEMQELASALRQRARTTENADVAARQRDVAGTFDHGCELFGGHLPVYRVTYPGGHEVKVRPLAEDREAARAEAREKARAKVAKQADRRRSLLGRLFGSPADLPVGQEPVSAVRIA